MNKLQFKMATVLGLIILSIYLLYPSFDWYSKDNSEKERMEAMRMKPKNILNLGLDLRGGTHLLLELEVEKLDKNEKVQDALQRAIEIIRNRIDQYGMAETPISKQGDRWISVDLPGISKTEQAEALIGKTAMLKFMLVSNNPDAQKVLDKVESMNTPPFDKDGKLAPEIAKIMPKGNILVKAKSERDLEGSTSSRQKYYVLEETATVTGAHLENAKVEIDNQFGYPHIAFTLNKDGEKLFADLTGANVGRNLAIVLDDVVHSAPVIKSKIPNGQGIIEGNFTMEEAKEIALILRAGALPAPVKIIEKRVVGPTLGEDSIKKGLKASILSCLFVALFMIIYYSAGGFISVVGFALNFIFLIAALSYFGATLTLPGIAGMILSLAMAIDANVLILERMREELELSRPIAMIIPTAYDKAWSAIFDSNLTTWITSVFLFQFGSGPVKGFATTLTIGLVIGVFTSVFVTRTIYDFWLTSNPKKLKV